MLDTILYGGNRVENKTIFLLPYTAHLHHAAKSLASLYSAGKSIVHESNVRLASRV